MKLLSLSPPSSSSSSSSWLIQSKLALHLIALLSLLALFQTVGQATASVTEILLEATTTAQSPSLRAPHRSTLPTRVMATQRRTSTMTATTTTRHRQPVARSSSAAAAATLSSSAKRVATIDATFDSKKNPNTVRPLRSIGTASATNARNSGVRQNRSLQSALSSSATTPATISNSRSSKSSSNTLTAAGNSQQQKHERQRERERVIDRRHHFRTNQYVSQEPTTSLPLATSSTSTASSAERHQQRTGAKSRRSKELSLPLEDVHNHAADHDGVPKRHDSPVNKNATQQRQTVKTPRMIHRLVAGHIQNSEGSSSYQVSAVSRNNTILKSTTTTTTTTTTTPKTTTTTLDQHRTAKPTKTSAKYSASSASTSTVKPIKLQDLLDLSGEEDDDDGREDDEALLDDPGDFDNWDNGILRLSAGSGKESSKLKKHSKIDESKKTLADQVRDGKYGLIEKELFRREPKRPGVLSYLPNKEVPIDNEHNFGGLQEDDIWLAEDHLLVIKGGSLNEDKPHQEPWPPIDDYDAPGRQIKLPENPKVPPPFPVQLEENGPVQFIGNNKFTVVYPVANESIPVYTAGSEADAAPSENDSDDEKNTITRSGTPQDTANGEPHYVYPAPYPSWLFSNQTFVNPLLSNARPITFPGLGPFPFGRNGSLENLNGTDFLDEDDPTLYYPPAYTFVYKNNYTNAVPPGPLVPGIVLPPPANQFSRLEKSEKVTPSTTSTPHRHRIPSTAAPTSTTTTSTTTTSTTTTTEQPFRAVVTKVSEYIPKIINIVPETPRKPLPIPPTPIVQLQTTTPQPAPISIEPIPVPVAIPVPIYPNRHYPSPRPNALTFVPTTTERTRSTLSKSNPIYYEYFEAKKQPIKTNVIDDFLASTAEPPPAPKPKPTKLYATSKRPFKSQQHRHYLQPVPVQQPRVPFKENVVYITPKPEIRYQLPAKELVQYKARPLENFEREVSALRETLRYYHNQQLRDNTIPRTPKVKPIYEFSFDATKNIQRPAEGNVNEFRPPVNFDDEPFKPMVTYSPPMNDENSFTPMAFEKVDIETSQKLRAAPNEPEVQLKYQPTTTLVPVPKDTNYHHQQQQQQQHQQQQQQQQHQTVRQKKQRLSAKYLQDPFIEPAYEQQQPIVTQRPWVAVGKVPLQQSYETPPEPRFEQYQYPVPRNRPYGGYYYGPPPPPIQSRQNNRFYDEPFSQPPTRKYVGYRPARPRPQVNPNSQYQQPPQQQQNYWSLENDTNVNYAPNRPPLNPDAEFIDPYQTYPYGGQGRYPPPAISHQSQYYPPPPPLPPPQRHDIPMHRDIVVNYRQPVPPINPDSEFIRHPHVVRPNQPNQIYRSDSYRSLPEPLFDNRDEQANIYYVSPKYRRANVPNNNNNNNDNNNDDNNNNNSNSGNNVNQEGHEARNDDSYNNNNNRSNNNNNRNSNADINNGK